MLVRMATSARLLLSIIIIIWILVYCSRAMNCDDVVASSAQLRMLDEGEIDLIDVVKSYIDRERQNLDEFELENLDELDRLVAEVEEERKAIETKNPLVSNTDHPVYAIRLIHRFTTTWKEQILPYFTSDNSTSTEGVRSKVDYLQEIMPTDDDYEGARLALIRLQKTYKLNVADVINGTILEQTTRPMTQQMAVDVAMSALDRKLVNDAVVWFNCAQKHSIPPLTPLQDIYHTMSRIHAQKGRLLMAVEFAQKALQIDPSKANYLSDILSDDESQTTDDDDFLMSTAKEESLCRQHLVQDKPSDDWTLSCFYERGRHTPMLRTKVEILHQSPDVVLIHDFVTDNEAAELRRIAMPTIQRATVGQSLEKKATDKRVGKIAWLSDNEGESLVDRISKRISETTGLETKRPFAEDLQLSNYGLGGHYGKHYDHDTSRYERTVQANKTQEAGDRMATFMIYLSHVEAGGATIFPYLDLGMRPVQNAAVFWYNYRRSGVQEFLSLHAACPVLLGEKWVANKWIREFGQVFRRPCDLSRNI